MIRNVCIHVTNEQPLLADLYDVPTSADAGLLCTNVRTMDGKRPVFIDSVAATFFFPYHVIRFLEIPEGALDAHRAEAGPGEEPPAEARPVNGRRRADRGPRNGRGSRLPVAVQPPPPLPGEEELELEIDIDEDFLQRLRDI